MPSAARKRRIAVVTGTRAEYGLLRSTLRAIREQKALYLQLVVAGLHLLPKFGRTIDHIRRDGWRIDARVPMQRGDDSPTDQAEGLGRGVAGMARFFSAARTDVVVVLGDRIEAIAGALAAVTTGCTLAHIHGGDVAPGDFDDRLRDAITKLADLHFAASERSARRILQIGAPRSQVFVVGAPSLDDLAGMPPVERADRAEYALVVQHAYGRSAAIEQRAMQAILDAVTDAGLARNVIYPNSDRGHQGVIKAIEQHARRHRRSTDVRIARSLPRDEFLSELLGARLLIGNSSAGLIEAPFAGTPSVNVGRRQAGREPGGRSVIHTVENVRAIRDAIQRALRMSARRGGKTAYGKGSAGKRIAELLASLSVKG